MPAPKNKSQLNAWLKQHGYTWVLKSPTGRIMTVPMALQEIEMEEERELERIREHSILYISGVSPSSIALDTGHVMSCGETPSHREEASKGDGYSYALDTLNKQEKDGVIRYKFIDGTVLIQHDETIETEEEYLAGKAGTLL